jgi:hypothetical protein
VEDQAQQPEKQQTEEEQSQNVNEGVKTDMWEQPHTGVSVCVGR